MIKTRQELETMLNTLDCQVFYNHTTQKDVVDFPYIVYWEEGTNNFNADNIVYEEIMEYMIVVHCIDRDNEIVNDLKTLLTDNMIPYEINDIDWDNTIMAYTFQFVISL